MADRIGEAMTLRQRIRHLMENDLRVGADEGCFGCQFEFDGSGWKGCNQHPPGYLDDARKGDYAYVGTEYGGAPVAGKPARVLFVSMDRPGEEPHWTFKHVQDGYRHAARIRGNPHMGGVDVEMEHLVDGGTSPDERCNQFALVNSVLCGPPPVRTAKGKPSARSRSTGTMRTQCQQHTKRIVQELAPDIVIAQGGWPRDSVKGLLVERKRIGPRWTNQKSGRGHRWVELWKGSIEGGKPLLALLTSHPAYYPGFSWKAGRLPDELNLGIQRTREEHGKRVG